MVHQDRSIGLLLNPASGANRREGARIAHLARLRGLEVRLGATPGAIEGAFRELAPRVDTLLVSGGDGTVSLVLTLWEGLAGKRPSLGVLPGGTTNLIARDLQPSTQEEFLRAIGRRPPLLIRRRLMKLSPPGACGLFLGGGLVGDGVLAFEERRRRRGRASFWQAALTTLPRLRRRRTGFPVERLTWPGGEAGPLLVLWATTLESLFGRLRPFPRGQGIRVGGVQPGANLVAGLWRFLRHGKAPHRPEEGLLSFCTGECVIRTDTLVLDGEVFSSPGGEFRLEDAGEVEFVSW